MKNPARLVFTVSMTAAEILTAAAKYNDPAQPHADWTSEDLARALEHASPFVKVIATRGSRGGVKCVIYAGIDDPSGDGGWAATEPRVAWLKDTDGRLAPRMIAKRAARYLGTADLAVPVRYENGAR